MSNVICDIEEVQLEGEYGLVDSVQATCSECGNQTESFGTSERSVKRCMMLMRNECPTGESNWYFTLEVD